MSMSKYASKDDMYRDKILEAGVRNLKQYGYPEVTKENILTDQIYSAFFKSMLEDSDNMGKGMDGVIAKLLKEIKASPFAAHDEGKK